MSKRVRLLVERIVEESFPRLKGKCIISVVMWFRFYALSFRIPLLAGIIVISTRTKMFSDRLLTGLIAHELCHQERYLEMGLFRYLSFAVTYLLSKKVQIQEEHEADRRTIMKGYAHELYELTIQSNRDGRHKKIIDNYMTPEVIREYAIKAGVW